MFLLCIQHTFGLPLIAAFFKQVTLFCNSAVFSEFTPYLKKVVPIFKESSHFDLLNFRLISLTSVSYKTMKRIVTEHIYNNLEHNIFSVDQYGFRRDKTVDDLSLMTYKFVTSRLKKGVVDVMLFDFYSQALQHWNPRPCLNLDKVFST